MARSGQFDKSEALTPLERRLVMARDGAQKLRIIARMLDEEQGLDPHTALELANEGYEIAVRERDSAAVAGMLHHRGLLDLAPGRPEAAIGELREAYELLTELEGGE